MDARKALFAALIGMGALWALWHVYSGWGTVSLNFENAPLGKVLSAIRRQGGIEIVSDLDPSTPVTIQVRRVPPLEALDIVAVRTEASWRLAYVGAQNESAIDAALAAFRAKLQSDGWTTHEVGGSNMVQARSGVPLDLRLVEWQPRNGGGLQDLIAEASAETGVSMAAPTDWSPQIDKPAGGRLTDAAPALFAQAGGIGREVFLLRGPAPGEESNEEGAGWRGPRPLIGSPPRNDQNERDRGFGGFGDPARTALRTEAQIKLLPPEEQKAAREDFAMMREFRDSIAELPEEQRRAKAREFFSRPEVQERMEDRRLARYAKMTPQQRIERSRRYWDRKAEAKYRGGENR